MDSPLVSLKKLAVLGPHIHSASFFIKSQLQFSPKLRGGGLRGPGGPGGLEGGDIEATTWIFVPVSHAQHKIF